MLYSILITIITLSVDIATDLRRWYSGKPINHKRGALLRLIGLVPACLLSPWFSGVLLVGYWILFNGGLAVLKGHSFWYVGTTAWSDRMLRKLPGKWAYVLLQASLLAAAIVVYIKKPL